MAKAKADTSFLTTLFQAKLFKASQGKVVRQVTFLVVASIFVVFAWRVNQLFLVDLTPGVVFGVPLSQGVVSALQWAIPATLTIVGLWISYALVNWPLFANFLISVEGEMDKVSWATWNYLWRATLVVLSVMFILGAYLFVSDILWQQLFTYIGFLPKSAS